MTHLTLAANVIMVLVFAVVLALVFNVAGLWLLSVLPGAPPSVETHLMMQQVL